jgi:hypothetical protein
MTNETNSRFKELVLKRFLNKSLANGNTPSFESLVCFLISHNLIRQSDINKYMILEDYPRMMHETEKRTHAIQELSNMYDYGETTIRNILSDCKDQFKPKSK